ncbi:MAG: hypothetical protein ACRYG2_33145 [Janthinobacterium lividum]
MTDERDRTDAVDLGLDLSGNAGKADDATLFRWLVACLSSLPDGAHGEQEVAGRLQEVTGTGLVAADICLRDAPAAWRL